MKRICSPEEAVRNIHDGASLMIGGFMCCGQPLRLIDALLAQGSKGLTVICNDAGFPDRGVGKLIVAGRVKTLIASHIGLNAVAGAKMGSGELAVELVPQGTLAERMRAGGAGIPAFYTPAGIGTPVAEGRETRTFEGRPYLLERGLVADFALVAAWKADRLGNLVFRKAARNFNPLAATCGRICIVEAEQLVEPGALDPDQIHTPGVYVHRVVVAPRARRIEQRTVRQEPPCR